MIPVNTSKMNQEDRDCAICHETFQAPGTVTRSQAGKEHAVQLPCGHMFGDQCITQWLEENDTCPQCRRTFTLKASESLTRPTYHQIQFHEIALPLRDLFMYSGATNQITRLGTRDLLRAPGIPALMEWVNIIEDSVELVNLYLSIVTATDPAQFTTRTTEGRRQMRVAVESLRHLRLFYCMRLFCMDIQLSSVV